MKKSAQQIHRFCIISGTFTAVKELGKQLFFEIRGPEEGQITVGTYPFCKNVELSTFPVEPLLLIFC